jgi:hypothetical protein
VNSESIFIKIKDVYIMQMNEKTIIKILGLKIHSMVSGVKFTDEGVSIENSNSKILLINKNQ